MKINDNVLSPIEKAVFCLRSLYRTYGYSQYKMSKFEEYDLYARNKSFLISDNIITFTGNGGKLMALKPDVRTYTDPPAPRAISRKSCKRALNLSET